MIIWGSRGMNSVVQTNQFFCPQCSTTRMGNLVQVRRFFTLYFIPIIPLHVAGRYVECSSCAGTFAEEIMSFDPETARRDAAVQMLRVMVMAALADDKVDQQEAAKIKQLYLEVAGLPVTNETLQTEVRMARGSGADLNKYVGTFAHQLDPHGKAQVVKLAFDVMSANGQLQPGHQHQLAQLANTLAIPQAQYRELITLFSKPQ